MTLLAQLTDLHLRDDGADPCHDPARALQQAYAAISAMERRPEALLVTGDLIDRSAKSYAHVLALLRKAPLPLWPMPGNHDRADEFRAAFADWAPFQADHLSFIQPLGEILVIALDSNLPGGKGGVDAPRLEWLARVLATADRPAVLALHHPPFPTLAPHLDRAGFAEAKALAALLQGSPVRRLIAGHSHRAMQTLWAGIPASTAPAIGHGLTLSLEADRPHIPAPATPGFELHCFEGPIIVSHAVMLAPETSTERIG